MENKIGVTCPLIIKGPEFFIWCLVVVVNDNVAVEKGCT